MNAIAVFSLTYPNKAHREENSSRVLIQTELNAAYVKALKEIYFFVRIYINTEQSYTILYLWAHLRSATQTVAPVERFLHSSLHTLPGSWKCPSFSMTCMSPTEHLWDAVDRCMQQCAPKYLTTSHSYRGKVGQHSTGSSQQRDQPCGMRDVFLGCLWIRVACLYPRIGRYKRDESVPINRCLCIHLLSIKPWEWLCVTFTLSFD